VKFERCTQTLCVQYNLVSAIPNWAIFSLARCASLAKINLLVNLALTLIPNILALTFKNCLLKYTFAPTPTLNMPLKPISNAKRQAIRRFY